ncbi:alanine racemase [Streptococcus himalayensis]|uniref:Alanine racemase n=1 Tax=Streptococcus himalayensis TaxID=1888195 RepID=A0A917A9A9_9STRE|nr:alanine racemase [Streptococcus himalayensis]GGE35023.1 alanine racemase [Streptococcus himalayensis]
MKKSPHRPTRAVIDLSAITYNLEQVAYHLPQEVEKWAVVKANAYGHGAVQVARALLPQVDGFCISNIDEALELRNAGITQDMLVLGVSDVQVVDLALRENIVLTVASLEWLERLKQTGQELTGLRVHIKVDSGMGRIGFRNASDINQSIASLTEAGSLVEGIFTHFATADERDESYFYQQLNTFKEILAEVEDCPLLIHASNSATSLWHQETIFNAVRLGVVLYGLNPSGEVLSLPYELRPALQLETEIVHVKAVPKGACIGYGATYEAMEEEWIATLPIGYADGWTRDMQGFAVLVEGERCPIVGRVSMDQITIALKKPYPLGTKVVLIGSSHGKEVSATDVAVYRGTINYEVVCLLSDRIPRLYP